MEIDTKLMMLININNINEKLNADIICSWSAIFGPLSNRVILELLYSSKDIRVNERDENDGTLLIPN